MAEPRRASSPIMDFEKMGKHLKGARIVAGYSNTQAAAARAFQRYGLEIAAITLGRYERGETMIPLDVLLVMSLVYEKPLSSLVEPSLFGDAARDYDRLNP